MGHKTKIILVEDEPDIIKLTRITLELGGFSVDVAVSEEECLNKIENDKPDIVLLDILLSDKNGTDILNFIKRNEKYKNIKVVIFSALAQKEKIQEFIKAGADDFIGKPFEPYEMIDKIKEIVRMN